MRYYVTADIHGFLTPFRNALCGAGYYDDPGEKKIVVCGDVMDRGEEPIEMQEYILELMERDAVILVRGNHEDLFCLMVTEDEGIPTRRHIHNGTFQTALALTGYDLGAAIVRNLDFAEAAQRTPFYTRIIPAAIDYYETERYVFVHGWIPAYKRGEGIYLPREDWRHSAPELWNAARWYNGMDAAHQGVTVEGKTVVCGHRHCSYGHYRYEKKGSEFGKDADFSPYSAPGVIALDACTAHSGRVNVIVLEDEPIKQAACPAGNGRAPSCTRQGGRARRI